MVWFRGGGQDSAPRPPNRGDDKSIRSSGQRPKSQSSRRHVRKRRSPKLDIAATLLMSNCKTTPVRPWPHFRSASVDPPRRRECPARKQKPPATSAKPFAAAAVPPARPAIDGKLGPPRINSAPSSIRLKVDGSERSALTPTPHKRHGRRFIDPLHFIAGRPRCEILADWTVEGVPCDKRVHR